MDHPGPFQPDNRYYGQPATTGKSAATRKKEEQVRKRKTQLDSLLSSTGSSAVTTPLVAIDIYRVGAVVVTVITTRPHMQRLSRGVTASPPLAWDPTDCCEPARGSIPLCTSKRHLRSGARDLRYSLCLPTSWLTRTPYYHYPSRLGVLPSLAVRKPILLHGKHIQLLTTTHFTQ